MPFNLTAAPDDDGRRLDRILRKALPDLPLSAIHRLLRKGLVLVEGKKAAANRLILAGEVITVNTVSGAGGARRKTGGTSPRRPLPGTAPPEILFEGMGLLVLNKPAGLVAHGEGSLEDLVLSYLKPKLAPSLSFRPGPLHRLDKPSSGLIAFSTNLEGARLFSTLMRDRKIKKFYLALVEGIVEREEIWRDELSRDRKQKKTFAAGDFEPGKTGETGADTVVQTAITRVTPLARNAAATLILAEIETGRTHQIRAQAAAHGHPLLGDKKYGGPAGTGPAAGKALRESFLLHAWRMEFPEGTPFPHLLEAPLPENFRAKIRELFGDSALPLL